MRGTVSVENIDRRSACSGRCTGNGRSAGGRKCAGRLLLTLSLFFIFFLGTGIKAYAVPATPVDGEQQEENTCLSHPADQVVTMDVLEENRRLQEKEKSGSINVPKISSMSTEYSMPLVVIVIGFTEPSEQFPDGVRYNDKYDWGETIFESDQSLTRYYRDMSFGKFTFVPAAETSAYQTDGNTNTKDTVNDGIIHVNVNHSHGAWITVSNKIVIGLYPVFYDAIMSASKYIDFASYDPDHDGPIENDELGLCFIVAGYEASTQGDKYSLGKDAYLWSHAYSMSGINNVMGNVNELPKPDGVYVSDYIAISEHLNGVRTSTGISVTMENLGTLEHELGHYLGLPDLYPVNDPDSSTEWSEYDIGNFSLMAGGNWGVALDGSYITYSLDVWSRYTLGWLKPLEITANGTYAVKAQNYAADTQSMQVLKINTNHVGEYYLVENRYLNGWDSGILKQVPFPDYGDVKPDPEPKGGIIIWHIDDGILDSYGIENRVNSHDHRPAVMVLYPERGADLKYTWIRNGGQGYVSDYPFLSKESTTYAFTEFANGFCLPEFGTGLNVDRVNGREESCIKCKVQSNAGYTMNFTVVLNSHTPGQSCIRNKIPATTKSAGSYYIVRYCTKCGKVASKVKQTIPKIFSGWKTVSGKKYYYSTVDGKLMKGWQKIGGKQYYLGADGAMRKNWQKISDKWYYFGTDGVMRKNWQKVDKKWYYLGADGVMRRKWQQVGSKWYYLGTDGVMKTGWQKISNKWYYFGTDGVMRTGWQKLGSKWYYLGSDGVMRTGNQKIGGKWYDMGSDGVCRNP